MFVEGRGRSGPCTRSGLSVFKLRARLRQRLGSGALRRLADVVVDGLADHTRRQLVEVGIELFGKGEELGPECSLVKRLRSAHLHGAVAPAGLAKRLEAIAAAQGDEEPALPRVRQAVVEFRVLFAAAELGETRAN